jgi:RyR domain
MKNKDIKIENIAKVCHEANRIWCKVNGDNSQKTWEEAEEWQHESSLIQVKYRLENPEGGSDMQHNSWMKEKIENGWVYGEVKNSKAKTHPCIVPFEELPEFQKKKDALFCAIVDALK